MLWQIKYVKIFKKQIVSEKAELYIYEVKNIQQGYTISEGNL